MRGWGKEREAGKMDLTNLLGHRLPPSQLKRVDRFLFIVV